MDKTRRRWGAFIPLIVALLFCVGLRPVRADPTSALKPPALKAMQPVIPLAVVKDIQRVRPGMTRADLDWLFVHEGGLFVRSGSPATYFYRYAGTFMRALDSQARPKFDKKTGRAVEYALHIKIDVTFTQAQGQTHEMGTEGGTGFASHNPYGGHPGDIITGVSAPYAGFPDDN